MSSFIRSQRYQYLSKFGCEQGVCTTKIQAKFKRPIIHESKAVAYILNFGIKTDIQQNKDLDSHSCLQRQENQVLYGSQIFIQIPMNGDWSHSVTLTFRNDQQDREFMTYYYVNDCSDYMNQLNLLIDQKEYIKQDFKYSEILFEINHLNPNESEFSSEQTENIEIVLIILILQIINLFYNYKKYDQDIKDNIQENYPFLCLNIAIFIDCIAHILNLLHLLVYSKNGVGIILFLIGNNIFIMVSQYIINVIVVLIGCGWTIQFMNVERIDDMAFPLIMLFGMLNMLVQGISHLGNENRNNHHPYHSGAISIIIVYKIFFIVQFFYGTIKQYKISNQKNKTFIKKFTILGFFIIICQPFLIMTSYFVPVYYKYKYVVYGQQFFQVILMIVMSYLIIYKNSLYNKANYKRHSILDEKFE